MFYLFSTSSFEQNHLWQRYAHSWLRISLKCFITEGIEKIYIYWSVLNYPLNLNKMTDPPLGSSIFNLKTTLLLASLLLLFLLLQQAGDFSRYYSALFLLTHSVRSTELWSWFVLYNLYLLRFLVVYLLILALLHSSSPCSFTSPITYLTKSNPLTYLIQAFYETHMTSEATRTIPSNAQDYLFVGLRPKKKDYWGQVTSILQIL